jgi:hypothetical protein
MENKLKQLTHAKKPKMKPNHKKGKRKIIRRVFEISLVYSRRGQDGQERVLTEQVILIINIPHTPWPN